MRIAGSIPGLALCAMLAACGAQGEHYDQSPAQVASALRNARLPLYILGTTAQGSRISQPDARTVVMAPTDANHSELVRFVATITPDGEGSRVAVAVLPPEGRHKDRVAERMASQGIARALLAKVAQEHVDAAIEHRSFDMTLGNPVAGAVPGMKQALEQAHENGMAVQDAMAEMDAPQGWAPERGSGDWAASKDEGWGPAR